MTIPPELEAQILRFYHAEKWRIGTIATQLHVHHGTVARVLAQAGLPAYSRAKLPPKPDESCHSFHFKAATDSGEFCHPLEI